MFKLKRLLKWAVFLIAGFVIVSFAIVLSLRWLNPPISSFMVINRFVSNEVQMQVWLPFSDISLQLSIAVIAAEDQKFLSHYGFDIDSIVSAISEKRRRIRGASTISQQVAKNLFLWSGRSYVRKALEAYFTVLIEVLWSKRRILEVYLNVIEFGPGVYGVQAASQHYFKKSAGHINRDEAALLAAVLPNPKRMHVDRPSRYVRGRADEIKISMRRLGGVAYVKF